MTDIICQPMSTYDGTMADCIALIIKLRKQYPEDDVCLDGDAYAIVRIPGRMKA